MFSVHPASRALHREQWSGRRVVTNKDRPNLNRKMKSPILSLKSKTLAVLATVAVAATLHAASIIVPNSSFESPNTLPAGVSTTIDSWQKAPRPAYFDEATFGFQWIQTAGIFFDSNPYANHDGTQCAYMLSFPGVTLFQDASSGLNATYATGQSYTMTLGVFGKSMTPNVNSLQLSLYYRDGGNNVITIGSPTTITFNPALFPLTPPVNLVDYSVTIPAVQAGDAWAGKNIGVMIQVSASDMLGGYWDMDNLRLTSVPEPGAVTLLMVGVCALVLNRRTRRA
jgi:hypothetical protein